MTAKLVCLVMGAIESKASILFRAHIINIVRVEHHAMSLAKMRSTHGSTAALETHVVIKDALALITER